jgi:hypothetical protein
MFGFGGGSFGFTGGGSGSGGSSGAEAVGVIQAVVGAAGGPIAGTSTFTPLNAMGNPKLTGQNAFLMIYNGGNWMQIGNGNTPLFSVTGGITIDISPTTWDDEAGILILYQKA